MPILDCIEAGNTFLHLKKGFEVVKIVEINLNLIYIFKFNLYINYLQLPHYQGTDFQYGMALDAYEYLILV